MNTVGDVPPRLQARIASMVGAHGSVREATTLRGASPAPLWRRPRLVLPVATAAMLALVAAGGLPWFGSPTSLSASQVLGRSIEMLRQGDGLEMLEYELMTSGMVQGAWRILLIVDHERPARYRVTTFGADGEMIAAFSQDPLRQRRSQLTRVDGRNYIVTVSPIREPVLSLPQMAQSLIETMIAMMQATADQKLTIVDGPNGREYVVEIPPVTPATAEAILDLNRARVSVDADDFRIKTFDASGTVLRQPFTISFALLSHVTAFNAIMMMSGPDGRPERVNPFEIRPRPGDVVLEGRAGEHPLDELVTTLIRELARSGTF